MVTTASIARVAALIGDPTRASMLRALMEGRALTAAELAGVARVARQTASGHLAQLTTAELVTVARQGRHRYHRLATPLVARMLESVMLVAAGTETPHIHTGPRDESLRLARTCYDHIAGRLGVGLADAMVAERWIELDEDAGVIPPRASGIWPTSASTSIPRQRARPALCRSAVHAWTGANAGFM